MTPDQPLDLARIQRAWAAAKLTPSPPSPAVDAPHTTGTDGAPDSKVGAAPLGGGGLRNCWTCRFATNETRGCATPFGSVWDAAGDWIARTHGDSNLCPRDADGCPSHSPSTPSASPPTPAPGPANAGGIGADRQGEAPPAPLDAGSEHAPGTPGDPPSRADGIVFEQWDDAVEWGDPLAGTTSDPVAEELWAARRERDALRHRAIAAENERDAWEARALAAEERCSWAMRALADREPPRLRDLLHARIAGWLGVAP